MKRLLYFMGLIGLAIACHTDVLPAEPLYQRWQLVRYKQGTGAWVATTATSLYDTEYRRDGSLVYRLDGQLTGSCCVPTRFMRQRNELAFGDITSCPNALCAAPASNNATITQLTTDLLELTQGQYVRQYQSVR